MSKQLYLRKGDMFTITNDTATEIHENLPPGVYVVGNAPFVGYYFEEAQPFELPPKFYGELPKTCERIISTYADRLKNQGKPTGVLLRGEKGGGKTLLAKKVANDLGLPVILVNHSFHDDDFKAVISNLGPSVIIFDEFEKVYDDKSAQNAILTLLDGVYASQCLFFVIVNDEYKLTDALLNRPGRLFYSLEYKGLTNQFITDYCEDKLKNKNHITSVLTVVAFFVNFNFDMLQGLVEEMNRYGEPAHEAVKFLNIRAEIFRAHDMFDVEVTYKGHKIPVTKGQERMKGHPFAKSYITLTLAPTPKQRSGVMKGVTTYIQLVQDMVSTVDQENEKFVYTTGEFQVSFTKNGDSGWRLDSGYGPSRPGLSGVEAFDD